MKTGQTSPAVPLRRELRISTLPHSLKEAGVKIDPAPGSLENKIPPPVANESLSRKKVPPSKSAAGFVLMDSSLNPISFNAEVIQILSYPNKQEKLRPTEVFLGEKIRSTLLSGRPVGDVPFVTKFRSGKRDYFCRAFLVSAHNEDAAHPSFAVLLERGPSGLVPLAEICEQFKFTQREMETLEYLFQGLNSKAIASRMNISPNTVKAFMRIIMIKTGVSSRSAVIGKVMMMRAPC